MHLPLVLTGILIACEVYIKSAFKLATFEQLLYSLFNTEGANMGGILQGVLYGIVIFIIVVFVLYLPLLKIYKNKVIFNIKIKNKSKKIQFFPLKLKYKGKYFIIIFIIVLIQFCFAMGIFEYLKCQITRSTIFEDYYTNPKETELVFPEQKQNLIYIFVESLETTTTNIKNGGAEEITYIPNLERIALNNINFSNTKKLGGALQLDGTGWTIAAMISQTSGIPFKLTIDGNSYNNIENYMPGVYSIGDILKNNGYNNYIMMGSDSSFAGRNEYFKDHGNYEIFDYNSAIEEKKIDSTYLEWWGFEDSKLFTYAKEKIIDLANQEKPFNFTMLTADTHFVDGYLDESCEEPFDSKYANVFYCSDSMINDFVDWIQDQDFYKNTTIVIVGDHLTMQSDFYSNIDPYYTRTVYNTIINSRIDTNNSKNREFSTMDMFPTTLASLGVEIKENRLGLGTNLFSSRKTLIEELGYDYFNKELTKKSNFYDNYLLGSSYKEIIGKSLNTSN